MPKAKSHSEPPVMPHPEALRATRLHYAKLAGAIKTLSELVALDNPQDKAWVSGMIRHWKGQLAQYIKDDREYRRVVKQLHDAIE